MEISYDLTFSAEQLSLLDMHSVLNVLNIVQFQLLTIESLTGESDDLQTLQDQTADLGKSLLDHPVALAKLRSIKTFSEQTQQVLDRQAPLVSDNDRDTFQKARANLFGIFDVMILRAQEILDRSKDPTGWRSHDLAQLRRNFTQFLQAIERNSDGGYHIVHNLAEHSERDYLIYFNLNSHNGKTLTMPPVFQDVMRDLLANARKYTVPGGTISAGVLDDGASLRFVVEDGGCGIPEPDVARVVEFGYRATNVLDRPTRGRGFGLTKAYYVTKTFGGRMWIESPGSQGIGTRVEIRLPRPAGV